MYLKRVLFLFLTIVGISFANDVNLDQLVLDANKSDKHLLLYFHKTGCPFCNKMEEFTFDDDKVAKLIKKDFIFVDINVKEDGVVSFADFKGSKHEFVAMTGYEMYPTSLFVDKNGEVVHVELGYKDEEKYLKVLNMVSSKGYNDIEQGLLL